MHSDDKIQDLIDDAIDEMKENDCNEDLIHEIADSQVPIYYSDIAEYTHAVGHHETELEVEGDIYKQIQVAIYELVLEGVYDWFNSREEEPI